MKKLNKFLLFVRLPKIEFLDGPRITCVSSDIVNYSFKPRQWLIKFINFINGSLQIDH